MTEETDRLALALAELNQRLDRLERKLDTLGGVAETLQHVGQKAPLIVDAAAQTAQFALDAAAAEGIDPVQALETAIPIALKAARPSSLRAANRMLDRAGDVDFLLDTVDRLDAVVDRKATVAVLERLAGRLDDVGLLVDVLDQMDQQLVAAGLDKHEVAARAVQGLVQLARIAPEINALAASPQDALALVDKANHALADLRGGPVAPLGLFGTLRALGDPDVQKAVGFGLEFARRLGRQLP